MKGRYITVIGAVIVTLIMALTLIILFNVLYAKINGTQPRIFGYSFHIVLTDSMSPDICAGDFIAARQAEKESIKEGDYIIFVSPDPALKGISIVHKVLAVNNENGVISFTTTGIKQGATPDEYPVYGITGKYAFKSPFIGKIISLLSQIENILFLIFVTAMVVIIIKQVKSIIKAKKERH